MLIGPVTGERDPHEKKHDRGFLIVGFHFGLTNPDLGTSLWLFFFFSPKLSIFATRSRADERHIILDDLPLKKSKMATNPQDWTLK
jgi:hypothetical protein